MPQVFKKVGGTTASDFSVGPEQVSGIKGDATDLSLYDPTAGEHTLTELLAGGGITPEEHRQLDQLVHDLDESHYVEYTYSANKIISVDYWDSISKVVKLRDFTYTYSGNLVNTEIVNQYDGTGTLVETLTYTYAYTANKISSVSCVRS